MKLLQKTWFHKTQELAKRGVPDIIACINGYFVAMELKVDSRVDELQQYKLDKIEAANGAAFVVTPKTWPIVYKKLKLLSERKA